MDMKQKVARDWFSRDYTKLTDEERTLVNSVAAKKAT